MIRHERPVVPAEPARPAAGLRVLAVDDEAPALEELEFLLGRDARVASVRTASDATVALRLLEEGPFDAAFLDIRMAGLDGLELARVLARFADPPQVVFVTAYDEFAVDAFDVRAADFVLKPVRQGRLAEAVRRLAEDAEPEAARRLGTGRDVPEPSDEVIPVELGGVTRFVRRADVRWVEAHGDYARLHTDTDTHLVRVPLTTLEEEWGPAGFVRIHRSYLVALGHVEEISTDGGRCVVRVDGTELAVSRRHTRELRDRLTRLGRPERPAETPRRR